MLCVDVELLAESLVLELDLLTEDLKLFDFVAEGSVKPGVALLELVDLTVLGMLHLQEVALELIEFHSEPTNVVIECSSLDAELLYVRLELIVLDHKQLFEFGDLAFEEEDLRLELIDLLVGGTDSLFVLLIDLFDFPILLLLEFKQLRG